MPTASARVARCALVATLLLLDTSQFVAACDDHHDCYGVDVCGSDGECVAPTDCTSSNIEDNGDYIQIRGPVCRVTIEAIRQALPDYVTQDGEEYILNKQLILRDGCVFEIHGGSAASSSDAAVSVLKLKVRSR